MDLILPTRAVGRTSLQMTSLTAGRRGCYEGPVLLDQDWLSFG